MKQFTLFLRNAGELSGHHPDFRCFWLPRIGDCVMFQDRDWKVYKVGHYVGGADGRTVYHVTVYGEPVE